MPEIEPIVLTGFGETMVKINYTKEEAKLTSGRYIGIHDICRGFLDICGISRTHKAIFCRACHLRIVVPVSVVTIKDLRDYLHKLQP